MNWPDDYINKVICGDCLEVMKGIPDGTVDLIVTDPPYDLKLHGKSGGGGIAARATVKVYSKLQDPVFGNGFNPYDLLPFFRRLVRPINGYFWCSTRQLPAYLNWAKSQGYLFEILTWCKSNPIPFTHNGYRSDTEYCVFIREKGAEFINGLPVPLYTKYWVAYGQVDGIPHPSPKPIAFMMSHIQVSSRKDQVVLDPYAGSGTTLVAAKKLGRRYIGIEHDPRHCKTIEDRLRQEELF